MLGGIGRDSFYQVHSVDVEYIGNALKSVQFSEFYYLQNSSHHNATT